MKRILASIGLWLALSLCADAQVGNLLVGQPTTGLHSGTVNINSPGNGVTEGSYYVNAFKSAGGPGFTLPDSPGSLDADGYPNTTLVNPVGFGNIFSNQLTNAGVTNWVLEWPATRNIAGLFFNNRLTSSSITGCTLTHPAGGTTLITGTLGVACRVVFTWGANPGNLSMQWPAGTYAPGSGTVVLARLSDEAQALAGWPPYVPEAYQILARIGAKTVRTMPQVMGSPNNYTNLSHWSDRKQLSNFSWDTGQWLPSLWAGTISGTDAYTVNAPPGDTGTLVDGYPVQGAFQNPSTTITVSGAAPNAGNVQLIVSATGTLSPAQSVYITGINGTTEANGKQTILTVDSPTTFTINVPFVHAYSSGGNVVTQTLTINSRSYGTKFITNLNGVGSPTIVVGNATLVYDQFLDVFMYVGQALSRQVPIEVLVNQANAIGANLWLNVPMKADDNFVTNEIQYASANLVGAPPIVRTVSGATSNGGKVQLIVNSTASFFLTLPVSVTGVSGTTEANGNQTILSVDDATHVTLNVPFVHAYTSGGSVSASLGGLYLEFENEVWNFGFPVTTWANQRGILLVGGGYPDYYGYAISHLMDVAAAAWAPRPSYQLHRVLAVQGCCPGGTADVQSTRFNGTNLNEDTHSSYCTFVGGVYTGTQPTGSCSVHLHYNQAPTRPVDHADLIADAPYSAGAYFTANDFRSYTPSNIGQVPFLTTVATLMNNGDAVSIATAMAMLDQDFKYGTRNQQNVTVGGVSNDTFTVGGTNYSNDNALLFSSVGGFSNISVNVPYYVRDVSGSTFRISATCTGANGSGGCTTPGAAITGITGGTGTITVGVMPSGTPMQYASTVWNNWESIAAGYDSQRAGYTPPQGPIGRESYEGGFSPSAPTSSDCTTMGITVGGSAATCAALLLNAQETYKTYLSQSPTFGSQILLFNLQLFTGSLPGAFNFGLLCTNSRPCTPTQFETFGGAPYSLYTDNIFSAPYETFYGFKQFKFPFLLKRDLDPAANDNSPAFIARAA